MASNTITTALVLDTKAFSKRLDTVSAKLNAFKGIGTAMGRTLQYAVGGGLLIAGGNALKAASDFDLTNQKLKALAGPGNARAVKTLSDTARQLGENSIYTASQVAEMQLSLKKLGLEVSTIDEMSESVLKFALAMDVDVNEAGKTVVATMKKFTNSFTEFNTAQEKSAAITEQFVAASVKSALQFDTLQSALGYVGAEANAAGFDFAETAAILGKLADAGFQGSRGGRILRRVLQQVGKEGGSAASNFRDLIRDQKEFNEVIKIVGVRAAGGTLALGGLNDEIKTLASEIRDSKGQVDAFSDAVDNTFMAGIKRIISAVEEVGIKLLTEFEKPIKDAGKAIERFVRGISVEDVRAFGQAIVFLGKALVAAKVVSLVAGLGSGIAKLIKFFKDFKTSRLGLAVASEIGLIGQALTAIGAAPLAAIGFMAAGIGNFAEKVKKAKEETLSLERATRGATIMQERQAEAFEKLEDLKLEEVFRRIRKGAVEAQLAFREGTSPATPEQIADNFIPNSVLNFLVSKADSYAGQFGATWAEGMAQAIREFLPKAVKTAAEVADEEARALIERYGGTYGLTQAQFEAAAAANAYAAALADIRREEIAAIGRDSDFFGDNLDDGTLNIQPITFEDDFVDDITTLEESLSQIYARGEELQNIFTGVGSIIGNAFLQAIQGARSFGDAIKQQLLAAIGALIAKITTLTIVFGLAALAKALFDGGSSIAQGAAAITKSGFGSFLSGNMGLGNLSSPTVNVRQTGFVAGSDLVLTTGRGFSANDRLYG